MEFCCALCPGISVITHVSVILGRVWLRRELIPTYTSQMDYIKSKVTAVVEVCSEQLDYKIMVCSEQLDYKIMVSVL